MPLISRSSTFERNNTARSELNENNDEQNKLEDVNLIETEQQVATTENNADANGTTDEQQQQDNIDGDDDDDDIDTPLADDIEF